MKCSFWKAVFFLNVCCGLSTEKNDTMFAVTIVITIDDRHRRFPREFTLMTGGGGLAPTFSQTHKKVKVCRNGIKNKVVILVWLKKGRKNHCGYLDKSIQLFVQYGTKTRKIWPWGYCYVIIFQKACPK